MSRWWRAYDEALHDPKLLALSDRLHRVWFQLLCVASKHGGKLPPIGVVALELRAAPHKSAAFITELVMAGLIDKLETGEFVPHNWGGRQFQSDVSTERVKRFRERERNVSETPPETETETETETEKKSSKPKRASRSACALPSDWFSIDCLNFAEAKGWPRDRIDAEAARFADHARAKGRTARDWTAAWRNWVTSPYQTNGASNGRPQAAGNVIQAADDLLERVRAFDRPAPSQGGIFGGTGAPAIRAISKG